jgi:CDP-paratose 2-epimerase
MKIAVIGGAGFIGCNLAKRWLDEGCEVIVFDNLSRRGTKSNLDWLRKSYPDKTGFIKGDIRTDSNKLSELVEQVDAVYHLAAQVAVTTSVIDPREDFMINALGTFNVLEAIRKSKKRPSIVYSSTNKVFGKMDDLNVRETKDRYEYENAPNGISEDRPLDFYSPYGCSKGCGDQYVRDYARIYGIKSIVFRQSCIYGERQFGVEDQGWVAWFTIAATLGKPFVIYGDGKQVRDILYIDDLTNALKMAVEKIEITKGQVYNIGGGATNTMSLLELIAYLEEFLGKKLSYTYDDWRPGDQKVFVSNIRKAGREFGWAPKTGPREGVKKLVAWVTENKKMIEQQLKSK